MRFCLFSHGKFKKNKLFFHHPEIGKIIQNKYCFLNIILYADLFNYQNYFEHLDAVFYNYRKFAQFFQNLGGLNLDILGNEFHDGATEK